MQRVVISVPQGERELAIELADAVEAMGAVQLEYDFGVGRRAKTHAAPLEFIAQLDVIENLAVEDNGVPHVGTAHRLGTCLRVDDTEATVRQAQAARRKDAGVVGAAMGNPVRHLREELSIRRPRGGATESQESGETTHSESGPGRPCRNAWEWLA